MILYNCLIYPRYLYANSDIFNFTLFGINSSWEPHQTGTAAQINTEVNARLTAHNISVASVWSVFIKTGGLIKMTVAQKRLPDRIILNTP